MRTRQCLALLFTLTLSALLSSQIAVAQFRSPPPPPKPPPGDAGENPFPLPPDDGSGDEGDDDIVDDPTEDDGDDEGEFPGDDICLDSFTIEKGLSGEEEYYTLGSYEDSDISEDQFVDEENEVAGAYLSTDDSTKLTLPIDRSKKKATITVTLDEERGVYKFSAKQSELKAKGSATISADDYILGSLDDESQHIVLRFKFDFDDSDELDENELDRLGVKLQGKKLKLYWKVAGELDPCE